MRQRAGTSTPRSAQISRKPAVRSRPVLAWFAGHHRDAAMAHVQQMARSQAAALDVVAGYRAMRVGMAADQHEGHAARGQLRQQRIGAGVRAAVRVAQDQAIHAPRHRHVDQLALLVRLVLGVGDEGQVAVFGGGSSTPS